MQEDTKIDFSPGKEDTEVVPRYQYRNLGYDMIVLLLRSFISCMTS